MLRAGQGLILITLALLSIGVLMVTSAGLTVAEADRFELADVLMGRPAVFALLAIIALIVGACVPLERVYQARGVASPVFWILLLVPLLLLLVHVPGVGRNINGASRWLTLGPIGFQPSELAKWGLIIVLAWYAAHRAGAMGRLLQGFVLPMAVVGAFCALIATEDLGTAVLIGMVAIGMLIAGGVKVLHASLVLPVGAAGFTAAVLHSPYRLERIRAFLDPYADPQGNGYHMVQSMAAVAGGGLPGRGLGNSVQKFGYLPEDTTDFIFAIICEELGIIGATFVITLYVLLLCCGMSIVRRAAHPFQRLLGLGIMLTIGLQALINLAVVTGCGPTKGIALPLVSAGGTGWVLTAFSVGLLVSMDRRPAALPTRAPAPLAAPAPS